MIINAFIITIAVNLVPWNKGTLNTPVYTLSSEYSLVRMQCFQALQFLKLPFLCHRRLSCSFSLGLSCPTTISIPAIFLISQSDKGLIKDVDSLIGGAIAY